MGCNPHYYGLSWCIFTLDQKQSSRATPTIDFGCKFNAPSFFEDLCITDVCIILQPSSRLHFSSVGCLATCATWIGGADAAGRGAWTVCPQPEGGEDRGYLDSLMGSRSSQAVQASPAIVAIASALLIYNSGVANARANAGFMASTCNAEHRVRVHVDRLEKVRLECGGHLKVCNLRDSDVNGGT